MISSVMALGVPGLAIAAPQGKQQFSIPGGDLGDALTRVAQISKREIVFTPDQIMGRRTAGLVGRMTLEDALAQLLAGTGLAAQAGGDGVILLRFQGEAPVSQAEIIVIGSRGGGRTNFESAAPVRAVSKREVERSTTIPGEVGAIVSAMVPSFEFPRFSNDGAADVTRTGQLRGLKPDQTLVLVNGKRAHTTAVFAVEGSNGQYTAPFDFNTIPTNAIGRIEVLSEGAGAQYGSDAIAGVLNIVLDDSRTGGQLTASYGQRHSKFAPIAQTLNDGRTVTVNGDYGFKLGDSGFLRIGGEALFRNATNRAGYTQSATGVRGPIPFDANPFLPNSAQNTVVALAGRVMTAGDGQSQGASGYFNGNYELANSWQIYAFGTVAYRKTEGAAFFRWPADWGGSGPDGNRNPGPVYPDGYRPLTEGASRDFGLTGGLKGTFGSWDADFSITSGENKFDWRVSNSLNPSLGAASPKSFYLYGATFGQLTANADFVRKYDIGLAGPVVIALGAEYRFERFRTYPGDPASYQAGPLIQPIGAEAGPGVPPIDTGRRSRSVGGAYIDLSTEIARGFTLGAAARYERYSDFGGTANGKLSARWEIVPMLALRGAISTNYRAPSLAQLTTQVSTTAFNSNATGLVATLTAAPGGQIAQVLGFTDLRPEKSTNVSVGAVFASNGFTASIDYYNIRLRDALAAYPIITGAPVSAFILQKTGRAVEAVQLLQNLAALTRYGFDVSARYRFALLGGKATLGGDLTTGKSKANSNRFEVPAVLSGLGYAPLPYQTTVSPFASNKAILTASYDSSGLSFVARGTRWGEEFIPIRRTADYQTLPAKWTIDLSVSKKLTDGITGEVGGQNVFDIYPDAQDYRNTYYGGLPYSNNQMGFLGAFYYVKLQAKF